jgi:hypothetical protein
MLRSNLEFSLASLSAFAITVKYRMVDDSENVARYIDKRRDSVE